MNKNFDDFIEKKAKQMRNFGFNNTKRFTTTSWIEFTKIKRKALCVQKWIAK